MNTRPVSLALHEKRDPATRWWCSNCREVVAGPWHEASCPNEDREAGA